MEFYYHEDGSHRAFIVNVHDVFSSISIIVCLWEMYTRGWPFWGWFWWAAFLLVFFIEHGEEIASKVGTWPNVNYNDSVVRKTKSPYK